MKIVQSETQENRLVKMISWRLIVPIISITFLLILVPSATTEVEGYNFVQFSSTNLTITSSTTIDVGENLTMNTATIEDAGMFVFPVTTGEVSYYALSTEKGEISPEGTLIASHLNVSFTVEEDITVKSLRFSFQDYSTTKNLTWSLYEDGSLLNQGTIANSAFAYCKAKQEMFIFVNEILQADVNYLLTLNTDASNDEALSWGTGSTGWGSWTQDLNGEIVVPANSLVWEINSGYFITTETVSASGQTQVEWTLPLSMPNGTYKLLAYYKDTAPNNYFDSFDSASFDVINDLSSATLNIDDINLEYGDDGIVEVTVTTEAGEPISDLSVSLELRKDDNILTTYESLLTDENGTAKWTITADRTPDSYTLRTWTTLPTDEVKSNTSLFTISKEQASWAITGNTASYYNTESGTEFIVTGSLIDNDDSAVSGIPVTIIRVFDGYLLGSMATNSQGEVSFSVILTDNSGYYPDYFEFILSSGALVYYDVPVSRGALEITKATIVSSSDPISEVYGTEYSISNVFTNEQGVALDGLPVTLEVFDSSQWIQVGTGSTNEAGNVTITFSYN
jgi:hypothetical protein